MKILIFTEGTILIHASSQGKSREEIIQQVKGNDSSIDDYQNYVPIKNAVQTIKKFVDAGHQVCYITSRRAGNQINQIREVLNKFDFPKGELYYRQGDEQYRDVVLMVGTRRGAFVPDLIIEDDCESIGGYEETIKYQIEKERAEARSYNGMKFIIIEEFTGIDDIKL